MNRETPFAARIAFRLPQSLYDKLEMWVVSLDRVGRIEVKKLLRESNERIGISRRLLSKSRVCGLRGLDQMEERVYDRSLAS
jgi:hypothetical protein